MQKNSKNKLIKLVCFSGGRVFNLAPVSKRHPTRKTGCNLQIYTCAEYSAPSNHLEPAAPGEKEAKPPPPPPVSSFCGGSLCLRSASAVISLSSTR